jgi:hypothetical protein
MTGCHNVHALLHGPCSVASSFFGGNPELIPCTRVLPSVFVPFYYTVDVWLRSALANTSKRTQQGCSHGKRGVTDIGERVSCLQAEDE